MITSNKPTRDRQRSSMYKDQDTKPATVTPHRVSVLYAHAVYVQRHGEGEVILVSAGEKNRKKARQHKNKTQMHKCIQAENPCR